MKNTYLVLQAALMLAVGLVAGCGDDGDAVAGAGTCGNFVLEAGEGCEWDGTQFLFAQGMNSCMLVAPATPVGLIGCNATTCQPDTSPCTAAGVPPVAPPPGVTPVGGVGGAGAPPPVAPPGPPVAPPPSTGGIGG